MGNVRLIDVPDMGYLTKDNPPSGEFASNLLTLSKATTKMKKLQRNNLSMGTFGQVCASKLAASVIHI